MPSAIEFVFRLPEVRFVVWFLLTGVFFLLALLRPSTPIVSLIIANKFIFLISMVLWFALERKLKAGPSCPYTKDLRGKTAIVTGGNTGIGKQTARILLDMGCHVILACRDVEKGEKAVADILAASQNKTAEFMQLDLASFNQIRAFAKKFLSRGKTLHFLINNAGVMMCPYSKTVDGFEMQFGTNHLGHFLLTQLLIPALDSQARVINVSSVGHLFAGKGISYEQLQNPSPYNPTIFYGYSKLANILFSSELQRQLAATGSQVKVVSLHPGAVHTELTRHVAGFQWIALLGWFAMKSPTEGAQTTIFCAVAPDREIVPGGFYSDCAHAWSSSAARDPKQATELWERSSKMIDEASK